MRFDPSQIRRSYAYILSCLPIIIGFMLLMVGENIYYQMLGFVILGLLSFKFIEATYWIFSFSLIVNSRFIYLTSETKNARLIWDDISGIYLGRYTWLSIHWLFFINKNSKTGSDLAWRLSVLTQTDQKKLLDYIKGLAKEKSVLINY